ncbi:SUN domain-containing protein 1 [Fopius arisanus]|uniref:SUN domain-containing protein 1 n=1 Tax=Fopius arisanus TaxID=64838 RepID=A0A0C9RC89_9HYME|nr:PREDICTED: SUN domain-containing protein 1-like [Fopius arisanus]
MGITKCQKVVRSFSFNDFHKSSIGPAILDKQNPFMRILEIDLLVLLTVGYYFRRFTRAIKPMLRLIMTASFGITLLLTALLIHSSLNRSSSRELVITGQWQNTNYLMQLELERLKIKTLSLELTIRKMNFQLNAIRSHSKNHHEILADFASESAGGSIVDTPGTESYHDQNQIFRLFGIPIWKPNYFTPRKVIQPWSQAGECWAFHGTQGKIEIELAYSTYVDRVTLEHISASASLTGNINSAPKEFYVLGKFIDEYVEIGRFVYEILGPPSQMFQITEKGVQNRPIKHIMLRIISNWGNPDYTCIYRFKVHGKISNDVENV